MRGKINYFFRAHASGFHSMELLFNTVISNLDNFSASKYYLPHKSASPIKLLKNCLFAVYKQGPINHITGDVNYLSLILRKQNTILTIHDIESLLVGGWLKRKVLYLFWLYLPVHRTRFITVVSDASKRKLIQTTGVAANKVIVVPNCIQLSKDSFKPKEIINKACPILLQIGTKSNKNLSNLISAIEHIDCQLMVVGELSDDQRSQLSQHKVNYQNFISLPYEELIELYYKSDIVTFVSTYEGFGMPILEAQTLGRPVITSNVSSMPEVAGKGAILVNPNQPDEIKKAILKIVHDDELRLNLVRTGYNNVQRFNVASVVALYEALYKRVLAKLN